MTFRHQEMQRMSLNLLEVSEEIILDRIFPLKYVLYLEMSSYIPGVY